MRSLLGRLALVFLASIELGKVPATLCAAVLLAALGGACDPGHGVTFENRTSHTVEVFRRDTLELTLEPFEKNDDFGLLQFGGAETFEARDENGRVIYSERLTWDDLKRRGWKITITEAAPTGGSPTPAATAPAATAPASPPPQ